MIKINRDDVIENLNNKIISKEEADKQVFTLENIKKENYLINKFTDQNGQIPDMISFAENITSAIPLFYDDSRNWWLWDITMLSWRIIDDVEILAFIHNLTQWGGIVSNKNSGEMLRALKIVGRKNKPKEPDKNWIQFKNHVYNIETGETLPVSREYFFVNPIPHKLGDSEETPVIDKIFEEWVGEDRKETLYEIISYCMLPDYPLHRLFCFVGKGRNGKGSFQRLIQKVVGIKNITSTDLQRLGKGNFETSRLYKKLVCEIGETDFDVLKHTGLIKSLTGQDLLPGEFKGKPLFDFQNYAKILIATNSLPPTEDKTDGFYSRWVTISFETQFEDKSDVLLLIPDHEFPNLMFKCSKILKNLLVKGKFTGEGSISDKTRLYEEKANPMKKFMRLHCREREGKKIYVWEFIQKFQVFCTKFGYRSLNKSAATNLLKVEDVEILTEDKRLDDGSRQRWNYIQDMEFLDSVDTNVSLLSVNPSVKEINSNHTDTTVQSVQNDDNSEFDRNITTICDGCGSIDKELKKKSLEDYKTKKMADFYLCEICFNK